MGNAAERCGVCDCFYDPKTLEDNYQASRRPAPVKKVKPLLLDLESEFEKYAVNGKIQADGLAKLWLDLAEKKNGRLTKEEKALIADSSQIFLQKADIDASGTIDFAEFSAYMLGDDKEHEVLRRIRSGLIESGSQQDVSKVREVVAKFSECDRNGDGFIDRNEIHQLVTELAIASGATDEMTPTEKEPLLKNDSIQKILMKEIDNSKDGRVNLWDVIALVLGRRKTPVELLLYDISNGVSKKFSRILLGRKFEAIYHSGVLAFGSEYWYGGEIFRTLPPNTDLFGEPLTKSVTNLEPSEYNKELNEANLSHRPHMRTEVNLQVVRLGYTLCTVDEFHTFLTKEVMPNYTRENYDVMQHNCNHCANEIVKFLTGKEIPVEVRQLPELVMRTPTARLLKPFLNKWLGGFGGQVTLSKEAKDGHTEAKHSEDVCKSVLGGDVLEVELRGELSPNPDGSAMTVIATVTKKNGDKVNIKYFNPDSGNFSEATVTSKDIVKDVSEVKRLSQTTGTQPAPQPFDTLGPYDTRGMSPAFGATNGLQRPAFGQDTMPNSNGQDLFRQQGRPDSMLDATLPVGGVGTSQFGLSGSTAFPPLAPGSSPPLAGGLGTGVGNSPYQFGSSYSPGPLYDGGRGMSTGGLGSSQFGSSGQGLSPVPPLGTIGTSGLGMGNMPTNALGGQSGSRQSPRLDAFVTPRGTGSGMDMPTSALGSSQFGLSGPRLSPLDIAGTSNFSQPLGASNGRDMPGSALGSSQFGLSGQSSDIYGASRDTPSALGSSQFGLSGPRLTSSDKYGNTGLPQAFDSANRGPSSLSPSLDPQVRQR